MDVFALVGVPFAVFLAAFTFAGYSIGGSAAGPERDRPSRSTPQARIRRAALLVIAAALAVLGSAAAAAAGAFARLTDQGYPIEPAALLFALEAAVDLALLLVVALPSWSARRAWAIRAIGLYWLCAAAPILILADAGSGSPPPAGTANDALLLGMAPILWEVAAVLAPAVLLWVASIGTAETP